MGLADAGGCGAAGVTVVTAMAAAGGCGFSRNGSNCGFRWGRIGRYRARDIVQGRNRQVVALALRELRVCRFYSSGQGAKGGFHLHFSLLHTA